MKGISPYILGDIIGKGAWGNVMKAHRPKDCKQYAVKIISKSKVVEQNANRIITNEATTLGKLDHPNIVKLYNVKEDQQNVYIILEYCPGMTCSNYLSNHKLSDQDIKYVLKQIISALQYIHKKGFVHGDIKLDNIIIDPIDLSIKLIDFGYSSPIEKDVFLDPVCGTTDYSCPEIICGMRYEPKSADIWAFGVVLYCLYTLHKPFEGKTPMETRDNICKIKYEMPSLIPCNIKILIQTIFSNKRPSADAILSKLETPDLCTSSLPQIITLNAARSRIPYNFMRSSSNAMNEKTVAKNGSMRIDSFSKLPALKTRTRLYENT